MSLYLTALEQRYHQAVLRYVQRSPQLHHHLDWEPFFQWLRDPDNIGVLAWENEHLVGVMVFAPPQHSTTWLRLLAITHKEALMVMQSLWDRLYPRLVNQAISLTAVMTQQSWVWTLVESVGFRHGETVVNLYRPDLDGPPPMPVTDAFIKPARRLDLAAVLAVDWSAFGPLWQMRERDLREAARRATYYTLAVQAGNVVGYQLAMRYGSTLHLARLATHPHYQGQRIASALVGDMILYAQTRDIQRLTVNTQHSNIASQRLYQRYGFLSAGDDMPVYWRSLANASMPGAL